MIYTAIFQSAAGTLRRSEYLGEMDRKTAWHSAAKMGKADDTLLVLVPGNHPVYTYESLFSTEPSAEDSDDTYEVKIEPRESVFEMT